MVEHDWLKKGFLGPNSFLFADVLWWTWRHRNNMCLRKEIWSISHLSFNIQNMVETFKAWFNQISNVALEHRLIKWNNNTITLTPSLMLMEQLRLLYKILVWRCRKK